MLLSGCSKAPETSEPDTRVFELRVYHTNPGKLDALHARFRDHTLVLFEKHGMEHIGYWTPVDGDGETLVYLIAFADKAAKEQAWNDFLGDPDWTAAYKESIKNGNLVKKVDSTLFEMTDYSMPLEIVAKDPERVFELRTYKATEGNIGNLDTRFSSATIDLFEKHGIDNVAYFHPTEGEEGADNTLVYMIAHESIDGRNSSFSNFGQDPAWKAARAASEENAGGSLTQPGGVTHQFLTPADYSLLK